MFFKTKRFELVDLTNQNNIEITSTNTFTFYVKDIQLNTAISSVLIAVIKRKGRDETIVQSYAEAELTGDVVNFQFTGSTLTVGDEVVFKIKVIDYDDVEHILMTNSYTTIAK